MRCLATTASSGSFEEARELRRLCASLRRRPGSSAEEWVRVLRWSANTRLLRSRPAGHLARILSDEPHGGGIRFVAGAVIAVVSAALTSCSATTSSGSGSGRPLPLGTATATLLTPDQCGLATSRVPTSRCYRVTVACPGVASLDAFVKVTDPSGISSGTILFGTGGGGGAYYEIFGADAVDRILLPLSQQGFRLVQRAWLGQDGWLTGPGGTLRLACRYAALLDWVSTQLHTGGALCATGNSGGSSEISYAMAHYGSAASWTWACRRRGHRWAASTTAVWGRRR